MLADDVPRPVLLAALASGSARRIRRGAYLFDGPATGASRTADDERAAALALTQAVDRQLDGEHWFCGPTAALVHGLPLAELPQQVHVLTRTVPGRGASPDLVRHRATVAPTDVEIVGGLPVTSLERTVLDCARSLTAREGLVVVDAAVRRGTDRAALVRRLEGTRGRGVVRARAVLDVADGGAESPGESLARYTVLRHGLPAPRTQIEVATHLGRFRADMGWLPWRLLLEFDGFVKYSTLSGGDPARTLFEEKRRQEAIEEEGWRVLRVTWPDLRHDGQVAARVRRLIPDGASVPQVARPGLW